MKYFIKALRIMGYVSEWSVMALQDNKVTLDEATALAGGVCEILGVKTEFELPEANEEETE